ncbi:MAG: HD domain-containing protein [Chitinophagales bacterium]
MLQIRPDEEQVLFKIAEAAQSLGMPAYAVGGFVRDKILKRPTKDIDIVCIGSGIKLAKASAALFPKTSKVSVFKSFGTAMFKVGDLELEFVGARKESYTRNSRKPIVEDGSLEDDQNRRDFTINALAISLNKENYGELIDPFDGIRDLDLRIIRTPLDPDITFSDDPLRMMRALRFSAQLGFNIDPITMKAIERNAERISIVSQERITTELNKIVESPKPSKGIKPLFKTGLLKLVFPEMQALHGVETIDGKSHKDNFYHTLQVLDNLSEKSDDLWLRWAAILHDIAKPVCKRFDPKTGWTFYGHDAIGAKMVPKIFRRLKLPMNEKMKYVQKMVALHLRPIGLNKSITSDSAIRRLLFEAGDDVEDLMLLCEADITTKNREKRVRFRKNFDIVKRKLKEIEEKDQVRNFQPPISGEEVMKCFNIKPGRSVGIIKNSIKEAILDGEIKNQRDEAWGYMLKKGEELGLKAKK